MGLVRLARRRLRKTKEMDSASMHNRMAICVTGEGMVARAMLILPIVSDAEFCPPLGVAEADFYTLTVPPHRLSLGEYS